MPREPAVAADLLPALRAAFGDSVRFDRVSAPVAAFRLPSSAPDEPLELRVPSSLDPDIRALFLAELGILRKLQHPNIVQLVREGIIEGRPYILVHRPEPLLSDRLWRSRHVRPADLICLLGDITAALAHCHQNGVVHAEVDPNHIVCGRKHCALDGFQRAASFQVFGYLAEGFVIGNPTYVSPELRAGRPLDGRSDIYSLGITAYECLAGAPPFLEVSPFVPADLEEAPPTPKLGSAEEERLYAVIRRMLAPDPSARYASADALFSAVAALRA